MDEETSMPNSGRATDVVVVGGGALGLAVTARAATGAGSYAS